MAFCFHLLNGGTSDPAEIQAFQISTSLYKRILFAIKRYFLLVYFFFIMSSNSSSSKMSTQYLTSKPYKTGQKKKSCNL